MAAPPPLDLITDLQEQVGRLDAMLFNYLGALQRDAPPQPLKEEPLVEPPKTYDVQVSAGEVAALFWRRRLPPPPWPPTLSHHCRPHRPHSTPICAGPDGADVAGPAGGAEGN
jgi:hypothetical protein